MKNISKLKILLSAFAVAISLVASAFTYSHKHATVVTSYFANESHSTVTQTIGNSVPSAYTRVTPAVLAVGVIAYLNAHCPSPETIVCLVSAQGSSGDMQTNFTITAVKAGNWQ
jgi:hypothetical protein